MADLMYTLGFICLILAPFTGITVVGAAAFFVIGLLIMGDILLNKSFQPTANASVEFKRYA